MGQKTLVGCAANRRLGASQTKVFARLFQKAAGEKMAKAHRGSWPFSRAAPSNPGPQPYKKARPAGRKTPCSDTGPAVSRRRDRRRAAGVDFAIPHFPKEKARDSKAVTDLFF
ncbi:hypothetical protein ANACOL_00081 [Anaerotruncus colihominis DSM 17241]|uniref:Uncharacterized protein n=1 Tax=Anaerotruncus colihominis DSM 17241 TaxID=445972 RepID=B0P5Q9_9FIRM|nr:hypothetical protein ANACOL_00081 [Anaerotruncus colihominis DSM 17241]